MRRLIDRRRNRTAPPRVVRPLTTWLLVAGFLLQPVLAYLVTPLIAHDAAGQQVVVCTLEGQKLVTLDLPSAGEGQGSEHCSALKLFQMAGSAAPSSPLLPPDVGLYAIGPLDQNADHPHRTLHFSAYATRAPPTYA
jgi:hypothetical protein